MKIYFTIAISLLLLCSCNNQNIGKERMDTFIEKYRDSFVKSDLSLFHYDPRCKFTYYTKSKHERRFAIYGTKFSMSLGKDKENLDTNDKIQKLITNYLNFVVLNEDSMEKLNFQPYNRLVKNAKNNYFLINDSNEVFKIPSNTFNFDPILYFSQLESLIQAFGILSIVSWKDEIKIIFDSKNSLIYFPNKPSVEDTLNMNYKMIDDFWYKDYNETNTDYW